MRINNAKNILLVSNYPSDTTYAWWLMEHFLISIAEQFSQLNCSIYLAYPKITTISENITSAPIKPVELTIPWITNNQKTLALNFIQKKNIALIYFTDQRYFNPQYIALRRNGVRHIIIHDHTPGDRPAINGLKGYFKAIRNSLPWITANNVLWVSKYMKERNTKNARIPDRKSIIVQNGIQPIKCGNHDTQALRKSLGARNNSLLVTTTGRAHPYKHFDFIINTASYLRQKAPESDIIFL